MEIAKEPVANFEGPTNSTVFKSLNTFDNNKSNEPIPISPISAYLMLKRRLSKTNSFEMQEKLKAELEIMEKVCFDVGVEMILVLKMSQLNGIFIRSFLKQLKYCIFFNK